MHAQVSAFTGYVTHPCCIASYLSPSHRQINVLIKCIIYEKEQVVSQPIYIMSEKGTQVDLHNQTKMNSSKSPIRSRHISSNVTVALLHERETRRVFEQLTGKTFCKVRPRFLRNPQSGRNLELDGFSEELKLAFEYDGELHCHYPNAFHRSKEAFDQQKKRDALKDALCEQAGICLIRVPHTIKLEEIQSFVQERLNRRQNT